MPSLLRTDKEITQIYHRHVDSVYRVCYSFMKNKADTEDMVQETFLRLMSSGTQFENESHERAWLIVTASNLCRDSLKKWWRKWENIDDLPIAREEVPFPVNPVLSAVLELPENCKAVVYMYYYEGYTTAEIARHFHCPQATIRSRLARARKQLKSMLGGESDDQTNGQTSISVHPSRR